MMKPKDLDDIIDTYAEIEGEKEESKDSKKSDESAESSN